MDADTVVAVLAAGVALVSMGAGISQARSAKAAAETAGEQLRLARFEADAAKASASAAEASVVEAKRSAVAAERANELTEAQMKPPEARWTLQHFDGDLYELKNVGDAAALAVELVPVDPQMMGQGELTRIALSPGESITPFFLPYGPVRDRSIEVRWFASAEHVEREDFESVRLTLPSRPPRRTR